MQYFTLPQCGAVGYKVLVMAKLSKARGWVVRTEEGAIIFFT